MYKFSADILIKSMGFALVRLWVIGYEGVMCYGLVFPANQLGKPKILWGLREYGLCGIWVRREATVFALGFKCLLQCIKSPVDVTVLIGHFCKFASSYHCMSWCAL